LLLAYIAATAIVVGSAVLASLALATRCLGQWNARHFHHLAQTLIPLAGAGVFLGLSALTVTQLRMDGIALPYVGAARAAMLAAASLWCITLGWQVAGLYARSISARIAVVGAIIPASLFVDGGWALL